MMNNRCRESIPIANGFNLTLINGMASDEGVIRGLSPQKVLEKVVISHYLTDEPIHWIIAEHLYCHDTEDSDGFKTALCYLFDYAGEKSPEAVKEVVNFAFEIQHSDGCKLEDVSKPDIESFYINLREFTSEIEKGIKDIDVDAVENRDIADMLTDFRRIIMEWQCEKNELSNLQYVYIPILEHWDFCVEFNYLYPLIRSIFKVQRWPIDAYNRLGLIAQTGLIIKKQKEKR